MADETEKTGLGATSDPGATTRNAAPADASGYPEPVILEERVIPAAKSAQPIAPAAPVAEPPKGFISKLPNPLAFMTRKRVSASVPEVSQSPAVPPAPPPVPTPAPPPSPSPAAPIPAIPHPQPTRLPDAPPPAIPHPRPTPPAPAPVPPPAPAPAPKPESRPTAPVPPAPKEPPTPASAPAPGRMAFGIVKPPAEFTAHLARTSPPPAPKLATPLPPRPAVPHPAPSPAAAAPVPGSKKEPASDLAEEVGLWRRPPTAMEPTHFDPAVRPPQQNAHPSPSAAPVAPPPAPSQPAARPVGPIPASPVHEEHPAAPAGTPAHSAPEAKRASASREDIVKILQGVKLPERRSLGEDEPKKPKHIILNTPVSGSAPAPAPAAHSAAPSTAQNAAAQQDASYTVHTLRDDLKDVVREKKISLVRATAIEQDKRRGQERVARPSPASVRQKRRTRAILFVSALFIIVGGLALLGVTYIESQHTPTVTPQQTSSILFAEQTVSFPLDGGNPHDLKQLLAQARTASAGTLGSITRIVPTVTETGPNGTSVQVPATLQQFFTALGIAPPAQLMRAIGPDFFFGIHTVDKNAPLFVIPVTSYDNAFAGMLKWEPSMNADLSPIFTPVPALTLNSNNLPVARTFSDAVMRNYDVRELKDDQGNVEMYYSFPTPSILIIAESPYSFAEILSRLQAERKL